MTEKGSWDSDITKIRPFLTSLPLTGRTNNYSKIERCRENSRTWRWDWSTLCTSETKTDCMKVKEVIARWGNCSLPQASTASHGEAFLQPPVSSVGKENLGRLTIPSATLWVTLREPLLWPCTMKVARVPQALLSRGHSLGLPLPTWESRQVQTLSYTLTG